MKLEGFSEEVTVKQRPEERKGWALGGRAFQAEGTVPTKAPRRSGEVIRLCSPGEPSRGVPQRGLFRRVTWSDLVLKGPHSVR